MKKTETIFKIILIFITITLISCNSIKSKSNQNNENLIIGTWIIEKSVFNKQVSPVPKGTNLKFTSDKRMKITLPKFGENYEDINGIGSWEKDGEIVTIEYDEKKLWGELQKWKITKLTKKSLEWEMKMGEGLQKEIYNRKN